ncbi:hypothetical protein PSEUBRA_000258 [Kalmanozyma brasiliensis GHG001]|uniref:uncharacterized protein n=1 Tax=Kalmanozyma brasiliensis (strain GHG001) TaxID=1365824 RepID=UPI0028682B59|nr:uncharacterized protein PSEUBRA_000258 [Kalmanozyma brasiliensis GHG001]KAF6766795.1 hypothetical protein PSEUBRA_000258 [Kalmanozyma brasiliensis GHG001]
MSATSGSTPEAGPSFTMGRQRTRNAQAQADLRVRRKAYIKTLEETVSSLEACVRQLRDQNAELAARASASASGSTSSSSDSELEELRAENARLYAMLAQAGLASGSSSSSSARSRTSADTVVANQERGWNHTSSITTKKRKVSKMQAFAKDVGFQLDGTLPFPSQQAYGAMTASEGIADAGIRAAQVTHGRFDSMTSNTPSSSSRESVVSHRSPSTPRFEMADALPLDSAPKAESIDMLHLPATSLESAWPVYAPSMTLEPTQMFAQDVTSQATAVPTQAQRADLATWLLHQHAPSTAHAQWPMAQDPSSSMYPGWLAQVERNW